MPHFLSLEKHFEPFRNQIIGINQTFETPFGTKPLLYMDWTASGRLYQPIEDKMATTFGPFVANTHTETTVSGTAMTLAYHKARNIIKKHLNAAENDVLITAGTGMTGVINKFQRILGLKIPESFKNKIEINPKNRPIVFISHMEHHSNQTTWLETMVDVEIIPADKQGLFCIENLKKLLEKYNDRTLKIASITSCSNVTGIFTPYYEVAKLMHQNNGFCFVDFACSAPYITIDMHPADTESYLDAIFFSPHKFLGGPGTSGVLVFNKNLYKNQVPDCPGGGTVEWTNPWGEHQYISNIELREDGGTPGFLQTIRTALAIQVKEQMGVENILQQEHELIDYVFSTLQKQSNIKILAPEHRNRLGVFSFYIDDLHFNLGVKILNDKFGIQTRGGCSCAGTYGHYLLNVDYEQSHHVTQQISEGCLVEKPGWIRMSIHPTLTAEEITYVCESIIWLAQNHQTLAEEYIYNSKTNEFKHKNDQTNPEKTISQWFF